MTFVRARSPVAVALALLALLALAGCRVQTEVALDVTEDGSGVVAVGIGLDDEVLEEIPGIADELRIDDLQATGWTVTGPAREADGLTWFRISKPFGTPEEAGRVLAEVGGATGPFQDFVVATDRSFARTEYEFRGSVDFSGGLESFGDAGLADALEGEPLGEDVAAIEARIGRAIDEVFQFRVAVRLPGSVTSNAPTQAANGAVWEPRVSEGRVIELTASSTVVRTRTLVLAGVAAVAAVAAVVVLVAALARRRKAT